MYPAVPIPEKRNPGAKCRKSLAKRLFSSNQGSVGSVVPSGAFSLHLITVHFRVRRQSWWKELSGGNILLSLCDLRYLSVVLLKTYQMVSNQIDTQIDKKKICDAQKSKRPRFENVRCCNAVLQWKRANVNSSERVQVPQTLPCRSLSAAIVQCWRSPRCRYRYAGICRETRDTARMTSESE